MIKLQHMVLERLFIRARYGGMSDTVQGCRDMYFKISKIDPRNWLRTTESKDGYMLCHHKKDFNWISVIRDFVEKHADMIDTVTIVRDFKTINSQDCFTDLDKRPYDKMPINDFLVGNGSIDLEYAINKRPSS